MAPAAESAPAGPPASTPAVEPLKVSTSASRERMSAFLVEPAARAIEAREFGRAVALYRGLVAARGPGSPAALELAKAWTLASQFEEAIAVLDAFIAHTEDPKAMQAARAERERLASAPNPFSPRFVLAPATKEAARAFKQGRQAFRSKKYGDALVYFEMGAALDPDLPGFLRELGATYKKLGADEKKTEFFLAYLRERPFGKNAETVRSELARGKEVLGQVTLSSSLPCEETWVNGQLVPGKLPKKKLLMAPGRYKALCYAPRYGIAYFEYARVEPGKATELRFDWAVLVNALENPYGRIVIEDPRSPGIMIDLGIDRAEFGVIVPDDGRALKMILKDDTGTRADERYIKLKSGSREVIKW